MKLKDCVCGGLPQVTYDINGDSEYFVKCSVCDNQTPICENLMDAVLLWNQIYYLALPTYQIEAVQKPFRI